MGLTNAPATFQQVMELVLKGLPWHICMVYLDDILIYNRSFEDHLLALGEVFSWIGAAGLRLKARKCHLARDHVVFLGHVVSTEELRPDPENTDKVRPMPRSATEVRAFLGLCSYYRRFMKSFAQRAAILSHLTGKDIPFQWTADCQEAFEFLWAALCVEPIVSHPDFTKRFILYTNASQGAVLVQETDGLEKLVAYASHSLTAAERRWSTYDRELWRSCGLFATSGTTWVFAHSPLLQITARCWACDGSPSIMTGQDAAAAGPWNWIHTTG